jgi:hypothetical protein
MVHAWRHGMSQKTSHTPSPYDLALTAVRSGRSLVVEQAWWQGTSRTKRWRGSVVGQRPCAVWLTATIAASCKRRSSGGRA